jgi:predicted glycoside hydrolase/deacetylase ChbG (UPF0249 family)
MRRALFVVLLAIALTAAAPARQSTGGAARPPGGGSIAERLGYAPDTKLLIVHADDLGMAHSVNAASIKGLESGLVNSASIMVPCPWFPEIAAYAKSHPEADLGLHLTLTSEWKWYRWGPVLSADRARSLLGPDNYLYPTQAEAAARADLREVEAEIRAQIERAVAFGIRPTHLDSHMGTLYQSKPLLETLLRVAREYKIPAMIPRELLAMSPDMPSAVRPEDVVIDKLIMVEPGLPAERWAEFYSQAIKNIGPGVTEVIVHLAFDDEEMRAATVDHPDWGAAWRQRDYDYFTSEEFRRVLRENDIRLVTWRELGKLRPAP